MHTIVTSRVFIVEDHCVCREGLTGIINAEVELEVCGEAGDIKSAQHTILDSRPDIVVLDLSLGDGNGLRLIEYLMSYDSKLPILVLSMHDESEYAERCLKAGAKGYIMKQAPSGEIVSAIRKVLKGEIYLSDKMGMKVLSRLAGKKDETAMSPVESLSNRELEIYQLIGNAHDKHEIADMLMLSVRTIETYIENMKKKLGLKYTREVIIHAVRNAMKM